MGQNIRALIGSDRASSYFKRPKGIRFRQHVWITKEREVLLLGVVDSSHLFWIQRAVVKMASRRKSDIITEAIRGKQTGKNNFGNPISREECDRRITGVQEARLEDLAAKWFPIYGKVLEEMKRRGIDRNDSDTAAWASREYEKVMEKQRRIRL